MKKEILPGKEEKNIACHSSWDCPFDNWFCRGFSSGDTLSNYYQISGWHDTGRSKDYASMW